MFKRDLHFYATHRQIRNHINPVPFNRLEKKLIILKTSFKNKTKLESSNLSNDLKCTSISGFLDFCV